MIAAPMVHVADLIESAEALKVIPTAELERLLALHESECVKLKGLIEYHSHDHSRAFRQVLRRLSLHVQWLVREMSIRNKTAKAERQQAEKQCHMEAQKEKTRRLMLAKDEDRRCIEVFKEVALEVLGSEMYLHLWTLAESRMKAGAA